MLLIVKLSYYFGFGLTSDPDKPDELLAKIEELVRIPNINIEWKKRKEKMLKEMIDVTSFVTSVLENFPSNTITSVEK